MRVFTCAGSDYQTLLAQYSINKSTHSVDTSVLRTSATCVSRKTKTRAKEAQGND